MATVPNVAGLTIPAATKALQVAGYLVGSVVFSPDPLRGVGFATMTTPPAGASLATGLPVALIVSNGPPTVNARFDFTKVIISQYANSPVIGQLVANMNSYVNQWANFQAFYSYVWDVNTAQAFGLDILGRIVGVNRYLLLPASQGLTFGFYNATSPHDFAPFNDAPFYSSNLGTMTFSLSDAVFRTLILVKALANISASTTPALNQMLINLFGASGQCYVSDGLNMTISYVFKFLLSPTQYAILTQSGVIPRPAGVQVNIVQLVPGFNFGFYNPYSSGDFAPFNVAPFLA